MKIIKNYLLEQGFIVTNDSSENGVNLEFTYTKPIDDFAIFFVSVVSHTNWFFTMEIEKKSLSNGVVGFERYTCFKGIISSENSIEILEVIFKATGINTILMM